MANIPITSCNFLSAFAQQSKTATRKILTANGFTQPKFAEISKLEYDYLGEGVIDSIKIDLPVIVKPDTLGSSIGITVAKTKDELLDGLQLAFTMCDSAIVEEFIGDMKEVNIAVMRHNDEIISSSPESVGGEKFFSFDEKYLNTESGFVKKGTGKDDEFVKSVEPEIGDLAKKAYEIFDSSGVVRSDFIITDTKTILNENNTVPGFMAYHLWQKSGTPYGVVIDDMIGDAVKQFECQNDLKTEFGSEILSKNRSLVTD
jgi:D-alanine-D-alanine ligase